MTFVPARGGSVNDSRPSDEWLTNYAPGRPPVALPDGTAFHVKAGSDFVLQFHYTPNGKPTSDRSKPLNDHFSGPTAELLKMLGIA